MSGDWRWKIGEAVERIRTRYDHIGRKTGAPFLALLYPPEVEVAALREWHTQAASLTPDFDIVSVDVLPITQTSLDDIGIDNVVAAMQDPMPAQEAPAASSSMPRSPSRRTTARDSSVSAAT